MRYSQLNTFGKVSRVLQWILIPVGFALAGHSGGWLGAAIGCGCALVILDQQASLARKDGRIERLRKRLAAAPKEASPYGRPPRSGSGIQPPPPRKLDITIRHGERE